MKPKKNTAAPLIIVVVFIPFHYILSKYKTQFDFQPPQTLSHDTIVADIDNYLDDPESFCRHLHLCPRSSDSITLEKLIDPIPDECTFGPAYWCKNAENIKKCKAEDYCKNVKSMSSFSIDECTLGPSYWCKNKENAEKCGATDYCKFEKYGI